MDLSKLPPNTKGLWEDLASFQDFMGKFHAGLTDPDKKKIFGDLLGRLEKGRKEAQEMTGQLLQKMKGEAEKMKAEIDQHLQELPRMKAELDARSKAAREGKAAPPPPPAPVPQVDKELGGVLAAELLNKYGSLRPAARAGVDEGEGSVARAWVEPDSSENASAPNIDAPTPPPSKPSSGRKGPEAEDEDFWEGLSRMGD